MPRMEATFGDNKFSRSEKRNHAIVCTLVVKLNFNGGFDNQPVALQMGRSIYGLVTLLRVDTRREFPNLFLTVSSRLGFFSLRNQCLKSCQELKQIHMYKT